MTLEDLLAQIATAQRPDPQRVQDAQNRAAGLVEAVQRDRESRQFQVVQSIPYGSVPRETALTGFSDVDVIVELKGEALRTAAGGERSPRDTIARLRAAVERQRQLHVGNGTLTLRSQDHSVGVFYAKHAHRVDLVPAIRDEEGALRVPEKSSGSWIKCYPAKIAQSLNRADRTGVVRPTIRLLKAWRRRLGRDRVNMPSYALELSVIAAFAEEPRAKAGSLFRGVVRRLADHHRGRRLNLVGTGHANSPVICIDPATGVNVTGEMTVEDRKNLVDAAAALTAIMDQVEERAPRSGSKLAESLREQFREP